MKKRKEFQSVDCEKLIEIASDTQLEIEFQSKFSNLKYSKNFPIKPNGQWQ